MKLTSKKREKTLRRLNKQSANVVRDFSDKISEFEEINADIETEMVLIEEEQEAYKVEMQKNENIKESLSNRKNKNNSILSNFRKLIADI